MRISVNGSLNLFATAAKVRNEAVDTTRQILQVANKQVTGVKRDCQELVAAVKNVNTQRKMLSNNVSGLDKALVELAPTVNQFSRQLAHWQRANEVPLDQINELLGQFDHQENK